MSRLKNPSTATAGGFVMIALGISGNALFLQPGRHPAPLFSDQALEETRDIPAGTVTRDVQAALQQAGYYGGPLDGVAGPQTAAAIRAFETRAGLEATGTASPDLLAAIARSQVPERSAPDEMQSLIEAVEVEPDPEVAAVQSALSKAAYGPLRADGMFGPQTRDAIVRFQQDHGLAVTGAIDEVLLAELRSAGALER